MSKYRTLGDCHSGYRSSALATGLSQPRHIVVDSAGNLMVAEGGSQGVKRLVLQEQGNIRDSVVEAKALLAGVQAEACPRVLFLASLLRCCACSVSFSSCHPDARCNWAVQVSPLSLSLKFNTHAPLFTL